MRPRGGSAFPSLVGGALACALAAGLAPFGCSTTPHFVNDTQAGGSVNVSSGGPAGSGGAPGSTSSTGSAGGATASSGASSSASSSTTVSSSASTTASSSSSASSSSTAASSSGCVLATCGAQCGNPPDNCGGTLTCGPCVSPKTCGVGGPYTCGCTPATCMSLNVNCGSVPDGCGGTLPCGACSGLDACGADGTPNVCSVGIATGCDGCPAGYPGMVTPLHNVDCAQEVSGCGTEEVTQLLCSRGPTVAQVGCGLVCQAGYHFAGTFDNCLCAPQGVINVCIQD